MNTQKETNTKEIKIFDTTMRDGEQSPGAAMTSSDKISVAKQLELLGVDTIEAGFPAASPGDFEAVQKVCDSVQKPTICALSRSIPADIDKAGKSLAEALSKRIHVFIATSKIHMETKLKMAPNQVITRAVESIEQAKGYTNDVEFSAEDAGRSEFNFLCEIIEAAIDAGATTINIPDTVGIMLPLEVHSLINNLITTIPNSKKAIFSIHCHNDLGFAVANSLAAVMGGARQVECTINGIGERAGNAALEEIVMALKVKQKELMFSTNINTTQIINASRLVSSITGFVIQPNKAIVGKNAFAHAAGIHQDGVIKNRETYEIMRPEDVGLSVKNRLVLSKHSGRNAFQKALHDIGVDLQNNNDLDDAFRRFKLLADNKREVFPEDLLYLTSTSAKADKDIVKLESLTYSATMGGKSTANVVLDINGEKVETKGSGNGAVDAVFCAIKELLKSEANLTLYSVASITKGTDAQGEVTTQLKYKSNTANGRGTDLDIVVASAKSYISAFNRLSIVSKKPTLMSTTP